MVVRKRIFGVEEAHFAVWDSTWILSRNETWAGVARIIGGGEEPSGP